MGGEVAEYSILHWGKKTVARWRLRRRFLTARDDVIRRKVIATRFLLHPLLSPLSPPSPHAHSSCPSSPPSFPRLRPP